MPQIYTHMTVNSIKLKEFPFERELVMEAYLVETPEVLALDNEDFYDADIISSELYIEGGRNNGDGRIDIVFRYQDGLGCIVEVKKGEINDASLRQLNEYLKSVKEDENKLNLEAETRPTRWMGMLVGTSITDKVKTTILNEINNPFPVAALILRRYRGDDGQVYCFTESFFTPSGANDYTKYSFNGKHGLGKGKLVLEVLKAYVEEHKDITFADLRSKFPDDLCGQAKSLGVFADYANITSSKIKRYFTKEDQLIQLGDLRIAVCSQWGQENIEGFIKHAKNLGFTITPMGKNNNHI